MISLKYLYTKYIPPSKNIDLVTKFFEQMFYFKDWNSKSENYN